MDLDLKSAGIPNFEEYSKRRDHYKDKFYGRQDDSLAWDDKGSDLLKGYVKRHVYEVNGYGCKNLEEVERTAHNMGYRVCDLKPIREVIPLAGGWCNIKVRYLTKEEYEKRNRW